MEVIIRPTVESAVALTARLVVDAVKENPGMVLGLATGRTMEAVYADIVKAYDAKEVSFATCKSFNLDEYIGLAGDDKNSYRYYMTHHLFSKIDIQDKNTHLPNGLATDSKAESANYEWKIQQAGGVDIQLLGIGEDGHIGFNEPISSLTSRTRDKALTPETYEQNSPLFDNPEDMPKRAFTMGVGTILDSKKIIMLVTGAKKANILAKAVEGPVTSMISASALQLHKNTVVIVDEAAAAELQGTSYYNWIFKNEPEWEAYQEV